MKTEKQINKSRKTYLYILFFAPFLISCAKSIEGDELESYVEISVGKGPSVSLGVNNTSDIAVTGGCIKVGCVSADIYLYVNTAEAMFHSEIAANTAGIQYCEDGLFANPHQVFPVPHKTTEGLLSFFDAECPNRAHAHLKGLTPNTTYYYRAFAHINNDYFYGSTCQFYTGDLSLPTSDPVNLGLSVKWASCNIGASSPEKVGSIYAWGESKEKQTYNSETYLNLSHDVASVLKGGFWRMPTLAEWSELIQKCSCSTTTYSNTWGLLVTGPSGYSIFLPSGTTRADGETSIDGEPGINPIFISDGGSYWSSTKGVAFSFGNSIYDETSVSEDAILYYGRAIRAVCP